MIIKFESVPAETLLSCDLCIVGAGVAGISLALEFVETNMSVLLVESGELGVSEEFEDLNDGEVIGEPFRGLRFGRRRGFGGTTSAWGGQCCELDAGDFVSRDWVPNSGWPIRYEDLEPYYRRAEVLLGVAGHSYDEKNWLRFGISPMRFDPACIRTVFSIFSPHPRIGKKYRHNLASASNIRVLLGATATNICSNANASLVTGIDIKSIGGRYARIAAHTVALCNGTIETARLLLMSRDVCPQGLGNDRDVVGRYLQDHPTARTASVEAMTSGAIQNMYGVRYRGRTGYWPKIALAPDLQRKASTLNGSAWIHFNYESSSLQAVRNIVKSLRSGGKVSFSTNEAFNLWRGIPTVVDAGIRKYLLGKPSRAKVSDMRIECSIEQSPQPDNRIVLSDSRDALGMQRPAVSWNIGSAEIHTFRVLTKAITDEFERVGYGPVTPEAWLFDVNSTDRPIWDNYHQVGSTRMSDDPATGVVDRTSAVHGVAGLYIAGAPTFSTSGYANPVLTIAALSIRLADHLKRKSRVLETGSGVGNELSQGPSKALR